MWFPSNGNAHFVKKAKKNKTIRVENTFPYSLDGAPTDFYLIPLLELFVSDKTFETK